MPGQHPHQQLCLPAQQNPKSRDEAPDILWPSLVGDSLLQWQPWCQDTSQGCDTSTAATDIPVWLHSSQPQKGMEQQSPCSSVKPRAPWGSSQHQQLPGGSPLLGESAGKLPLYFHSSKPVKQGDNTPDEFPGFQLPLVFPAHPGQEQEQEQEQSRAAQVRSCSG